MCSWESCVAPRGGVGVGCASTPFTGDVTGQAGQNFNRNPAAVSCHHRVFLFIGCQIFVVVMDAGSMFMGRLECPGTVEQYKGQCVVQSKAPLTRPQAS